MNLVALVVIALLLAGAVAVTRRNRRRLIDAQVAGAHDLRPGAEVMTTSGLYGTVVELGQDDTATLAIAPGVEVKWALAALRQADEVPARYRRGMPTPAPVLLEKHPAPWPITPPLHAEETDTN